MLRRGLKITISMHYWRWLIAAVAIFYTACQPLEPSGRQFEPEEQEANPQPSPSAKPINRSISIHINFVNPEEEAQVFDHRVQPVLRNSCLTAGCHAAPEVIDLRSFPFDASGSYTMDRIKAELGEDFEELAAQKIIVDELINAMQSGYMPPPEYEPIDSAVISDFTVWLDAGLPVADYRGTLNLTGWSERRKQCEFKLPVSSRQAALKIDLSKCQSANMIRYRLIMDHQGAVKSGTWHLDQPGAPSTFKIDAAKVD